MSESEEYESFDEGEEVEEVEEEEELEVDEEEEEEELEEEVEEVVEEVEGKAKDDEIEEEREENKVRFDREIDEFREANEEAINDAVEEEFLELTVKNIEQAAEKLAGGKDDFRKKTRKEKDDLRIQAKALIRSAKVKNVAVFDRNRKVIYYNDVKVPWAPTWKQMEDLTGLTFGEKERPGDYQIALGQEINIKEALTSWKYPKTIEGPRDPEESNKYARSIKAKTLQIDMALSEIEDIKSGKEALNPVDVNPPEVNDRIKASVKKAIDEEVKEVTASLEQLEAYDEDHFRKEVEHQYPEANEEEIGFLTLALQKQHEADIELLQDRLATLENKRNRIIRRRRVLDVQVSESSLSSQVIGNMKEDVKRYETIDPKETADEIKRIELKKKKNVGDIQLLVKLKDDLSFYRGFNHVNTKASLEDTSLLIPALRALQKETASVLKEPDAPERDEKIEDIQLRLSGLLYKAQWGSWDLSPKKEKRIEKLKAKIKRLRREIETIDQQKTKFYTHNTVTDFMDRDPQEIVGVSYVKMGVKGKVKGFLKNMEVEVTEAKFLEDENKPGEGTWMIKFPGDSFEHPFPAKDFRLQGKENKKHPEASVGSLVLVRIPGFEEEDEEEEKEREYEELPPYTPKKNRFVIDGLPLSYQKEDVMKLDKNITHVEFKKNYALVTLSAGLSKEAFVKKISGIEPIKGRPLGVRQAKTVVEKIISYTSPAPRKPQRPVMLASVISFDRDSVQVKPLPRSTIKMLEARREELKAKIDFLESEDPIDIRIDILNEMKLDLDRDFDILKKYSKGKRLDVIESELKKNKKDTESLYSVGKEVFFEAEKEITRTVTKKEILRKIEALAGPDVLENLRDRVSGLKERIGDEEDKRKRRILERRLKEAETLVSSSVEEYLEKLKKSKKAIIEQELAEVEGGTAEEEKEAYEYLGKKIKILKKLKPFSVTYEELEKANRPKFYVSKNVGEIPLNKTHVENMETIYFDIFKKFLLPPEKEKVEEKFKPAPVYPPEEDPVIHTAIYEAWKASITKEFRTGTIPPILVKIVQEEIERDLERTPDEFLDILIKETNLPDGTSIFNGIDVVTPSLDVVSGETQKLLKRLRTISSKALTSSITERFKVNLLGVFGSDNPPPLVEVVRNTVNDEVRYIRGLPSLSPGKREGLTYEKRLKDQRSLFLQTKYESFYSEDAEEAKNEWFSFVEGAKRPKARVWTSLLSKEAKKFATKKLNDPKWMEEIKNRAERVKKNVKKEKDIIAAKEAEEAKKVEQEREATIKEPWTEKELKIAIKGMLNSASNESTTLKEMCYRLALVNLVFGSVVAPKFLYIKHSIRNRTYPIESLIVGKDIRLIAPELFLSTAKVNPQIFNQILASIKPEKLTIIELQFLKQTESFYERMKGIFSGKKDLSGKTQAEFPYEMSDALIGKSDLDKMSDEQIRRMAEHEGLDLKDTDKRPQLIERLLRKAGSINGACEKTTKTGKRMMTFREIVKEAVKIGQRPSKKDLENFNITTDIPVEDLYLEINGGNFKCSSIREILDEYYYGDPSKKPNLETKYRTIIERYDRPTDVLATVNNIKKETALSEKLKKKYPKTEGSFETVEEVAEWILEVWRAKTAPKVREIFVRGVVSLDGPTKPKIPALTSIWITYGGIKDINVFSYAWVTGFNLFEEEGNRKFFTDTPTSPPDLVVYIFTEGLDHKNIAESAYLGNKYPNLLSGARYFLPIVLGGSTMTSTTFNTILEEGKVLKKGESQTAGYRLPRRTLFDGSDLYRIEEDDLGTDKILEILLELEGGSYPEYQIAEVEDLKDVVIQYINSNYARPLVKQIEELTDGRPFDKKVLVEMGTIFDRLDSLEEYPPLDTEDLNEEAVDYFQRDEVIDFFSQLFIKNLFLRPYQVPTSIEEINDLIEGDSKGVLTPEEIVLFQKIVRKYRLEKKSYVLKGIPGSFFAGEVYALSPSIETVKFVKKSRPVKQSGKVYKEEREELATTEYSAEIPPLKGAGGDYVVVTLYPDSNPEDFFNSVKKREILHNQPESFAVEVRRLDRDFKKFEPVFIKTRDLQIGDLLITFDLDDLKGLKELYPNLRKLTYSGEGVYLEPPKEGEKEAQIKLKSTNLGVEMVFGEIGKERKVFDVSMEGTNEIGKAYASSERLPFLDEETKNIIFEKISKANTKNLIVSNLRWLFDLEGLKALKRVYPNLDFIEYSSDDRTYPQPPKSTNEDVRAVFDDPLRYKYVAVPIKKTLEILPQPDETEFLNMVVDHSKGKRIEFMNPIFKSSSSIIVEALAPEIRKTGLNELLDKVKKMTDSALDIIDRALGFRPNPSASKVINSEQRAVAVRLAYVQLLPDAKDKVIDYISKKGVNAADLAVLLSPSEVKEDTTNRWKTVLEWFRDTGDIDQDVVLESYTKLGYSPGAKGSEKERNEIFERLFRARFSTLNPPFQAALLRMSTQKLASGKKGTKQYLDASNILFGGELPEPGKAPKIKSSKTSLPVPPPKVGRAPKVKSTGAPKSKEIFDPLTWQPPKPIQPDKQETKAGASKLLETLGRLLNVIDKNSLNKAHQELEEASETKGVKSKSKEYLQKWLATIGDYYDIKNPTLEALTGLFAEKIEGLSGLDAFKISLDPQILSPRYFFLLSNFSPKENIASHKTWSAHQEAWVEMATLVPSPLEKEEEESRSIVMEKTAIEQEKKERTKLRSSLGGKVTDETAKKLLKKKRSIDERKEAIEDKIKELMEEGYDEEEARLLAGEE